MSIISWRPLWCCLVIVWHFNEVVVWISEVQRGDGPHSPTPPHWALLYLHSTNLQRRRDTELTEHKTEMWYRRQVDLVLASSSISIDNITWSTFKCAATIARGVLVMRHRSAEPEVGCLAFGSNSWPSWWRLNFCCPKPRALRFPYKCRDDVWGLRRVWLLKLALTVWAWMLDL